MAEEKYGFTDEAAIEDKFGITDYIGGLAKFVEKCNTPLTMSIQGSWGTGKTSIMNLVKNELSKDIVPIWFNTWQFSQFNMDNQLAVSLLSSLISEFNIKDQAIIKEANKLIKGLKLVTDVGKNFVLDCIDSKIGERTTNLIEAATKKVGENGSEPLDENDYMDPTVAIRKLRLQFADCVQKTLTEQNKKRIVIFIDDLDRLEPKKAVELLEVLKIFLDCRNCVFVLAIDYDVVCRGVAAKYGSLADDETEAAEKGKSFFDKIIQVPFKMPVARYNISGYVESCFEKIGISFDKEDLHIYVDLIKHSIGTNPRSMKRLFNSYQLLTIVVPDTLLSASKNQQLLFAILCLQYCSESIYNFMIRHSEELNVDIFNAIVDCKYDDFSEKVNDLEDLTEEDLATANSFMEKFRDAVVSDVKEGINNSELQNFIQVLNFSAITSSSDTEPSTPRRQPAKVVQNTSELNFKYAENTAADLDKVMNAISKETGTRAKATLKNRKNNITVEYSFDSTKLFWIDLFERKGGFSVQISGEQQIFDKLPPYARQFICNKKLSVNPYAKGKYFQFTVKNGNDNDLREMQELIQAFMKVLA